MGPTTIEVDADNPLTLEGRLSNEEIPKERRRDSQEISRPNSSGTLSRKHVNTDVTENEIRETQLIVDLRERIRSGDKDAQFELGQIYFEKREFKEARELFEGIEEDDMQAKYQLAVMFYDGLGVEADHVNMIANLFFGSQKFASLLYTCSTICQVAIILF